MSSEKAKQARRAMLIDVGQVAPEAVVTCRAPDDPARREWALVRGGEPDRPRWSLVFRGQTLDQASVSLPLADARPAVEPGRVALSYRSANGGRSVELNAVARGASAIDVFVNFELEVNVERDLDRAVEAMNTDGTLGVQCDVSPPARASTPPPAQLPAVSSARSSGPPSTEWMIGVGAAWSMDLLQSRGGRRYLAQTVSWGRDVTRDVGPSVLRGRLLWAVEAMPVLWQTAPSTTYGVGISPLVWRWQFVPRAHVTPFAELAFGGLFTRASVPEGTGRANFLSHGTFGLRWRSSTSVSLVTAYRFQHISNGNQLSTNPGVNAHVLWMGIGIASR